MAREQASKQYDPQQLIADLDTATKNFEEAEEAARMARHTEAVMRERLNEVQKRFDKWADSKRNEGPRDSNWGQKQLERRIGFTPKRAEA